MFGMGSWNRGNFGRKAGIAGILAGGGLRRAAVMGLGMMAYRWWRNHQAAKPAGRRGASGQDWNVRADVAGRSGATVGDAA